MTPSLAAALRSVPLILTEGAVIERLRREPGGWLDPVAANAPLLYDPAGRRALERIYGEYLAAAREAGLPLLLLTPTWRANPERLRAAGLEGRPVQADAFRFLDALRRKEGSAAFIGGLMGCRGDAYDPRETLPEDEAEAFHAPQAAALAGAGVDLLYGATLPALPEAAGMARAMGATGLPFILGFPLRPDGTLLDGVPMREAAARIDASAHPAPLGYMGHCVHPATFDAAMGAAFGCPGGGTGRWIGLQANASPLDPEELDGAAVLHGDSPDDLAHVIAAVVRRWDLRIGGGCCGTDARLTAALGKMLAAR